MKSKGDFIHDFTGTVFPEQIEGYTRNSIYSFNKQNDDIEDNYKKPDGNAVVIKIYPAGDGIDGRLRNKYLNTLQSISDEVNKTVSFEQGPIRRVGEKYICNGFMAVFS